jgi:hypothetical protein
MSQAPPATPSLNLIDWSCSRLYPPGVCWDYSDSLLGLETPGILPRTFSCLVGKFTGRILLSAKDDLRLQPLLAGHDVC